MKPNRKGTIIFDLGGVILNLDIPRSFQKFEKLTGIPAVKTEAMLHRQSFFLDYELGMIDDREFRQSIREMAGKPLKEEDIDEAWNAMLLDVPQQRLDWIMPLTKQYQLVLLSNTNSLHINRLTEIFKRDTCFKGPEEVFDRLYYSFRLNMRKPNEDIFHYVLKDLDLLPSEAVLIDDNELNIAAAKSLGLRTIFVNHNQLTKEQLPHGAN